jgi:hypothetical protein
MIGSKTLLQHVIKSELDEFIQKNQFIYTSIDTPTDFNLDGSFVAELNSSGTAFKKAIDEDHRKMVTSFQQINSNEYRQQLGEKIIKLTDNYSLKQSLNIISEVHKKVGDAFAGALLILNTGAIINPLHPIAALELLSSCPEPITKILIYTYKDLDRIQQLYGINMDFDAEANIKLLMQIYQSKVTERGTKVIKNDVNMENQNITQHFSVSKFNGEDDEKEYYLVTHQLLTAGTYVPYYGTSIIQIGDNTSGYHLTPFKSCNMQRHSNPAPASVCTGSTSNRTIEGLRTLHHSNLSSPYDRNCMSTASYQYAKECIKQSLNIFKTANLISKDSYASKILSRYVCPKP